MHSMISKTSLIIFLSVFLLNAASPLITMANDSTAARLIHVKGKVFYSTDQGNTWKPVRDKNKFGQGIYLKTGENSKAAVILKDRSQIRLNENSVLNIESAGSEPNTEDSLKKSIINFFKGKLWFRNKRRTENPDINTPFISASIRGTEVSLEVKEDGSSLYTVLEGQLVCKNDYGKTTARRGEEVFAEKGKAPEAAALLKPENAVQWLLLTPDIKGPAEKTIPADAQNALNALIENKVEKALNFAEKAVALSPESASSHVILATCYQRKGKFEKGFDYALKSRKFDPESVPALVRAVELALGLNLINRAGEMINSFTGNHNDPVVIMLKGYTELIRQEPLKAEQLFKKALAQRSDLSKAYLGLGLAQFQTGKTGPALENLEYASLLNPLAAYPHNYLGKALLETGERSEALAELTRASQLDPNDPTPHLYIAAIKADSFRPVQAVHSLQRAIELNDNRLVTRSKYLLDSDTAVKNINMAWSLSQLGLYNWAEFLGDSAVWSDHSNSSAYMFRGVRSIATDDVSPSTLGDSRRELLLKPVNGNTYVTYSDYYSLMDKPLFKTTLAASGGNNSSGAGRMTFHGGRNKTAYSLDFLHSATDGIKNGAGESTTRGIASAKHSLALNHEVAGEVIAGNIDLEDTLLRQNGDLAPADKDTEIDFYSITAGYHYKHGTDNHLLCLVQSQKRNSDRLSTEKLDNVFLKTPRVEETLYEDLETDSIINRIELAELMTSGNHNLTMGAGWYDKNTEQDTAQRVVFSSDVYPDYNWSTEDEFDNTEYRIFTRDIWRVLPEFMIDIQAGWSEMKDIEINNNGNRSDRSEFLHQIGGAWDINSSHRLRTAWYKELEQDYLNGSLQPVEAAGFEKILGTVPGTVNETFGLGWDCTWTPDIFTSVEIYTRDIDYPAPFNPIESENITWEDEERRGIGLAYEQILTERIALSVTYDLIEVTSSSPDTERVDSEAGTSVNWIHPSGWSVKTGVWYVDQDEEKGYGNLEGDSFITGDISVAKKFGRKKHSFFIRCENIADEKYLYMVRDTIQSSQLPEQGRLFEVGFRLNF